MNVSELINVLEKFPKDKEVKILYYDDSGEILDDISEVSFPMEVNPDDYDDIEECKEYVVIFSEEYCKCLMDTL